MRLFGSIKELVSAVFRKDTYEVTLKPNSNTYTGATEFQLPPKTNGNGVLVASGDIVNADIAAGAAIVDTKLATISTAGKVSNSATTATSSNTASAIVARDSSGNFSAGTITASLSGNVTGNVSGSAASFTGSLSGEVTGTQSATVVADDVIDNANIKSTAAIAYSKLNLSSSIVNADISNSAGIVDTKLATISTAGKVANSATTATSAATPSTIVARDVNGSTNLSGLGVSGNLTTNNLEATGQSLLQFAYINGTAGMGFVEMEGQSTSAVAAPTVGEARLFSGTDGKIYVRKKGSSAAEELGASGSGEVNLVDTPSDAGSWVGVNATVTTNTTAANNPLAGVIDSSISIASSTLNGYARTRFTMPSALKNRKLKLEWFQIAASLSSGAYKVEVYTNASSDYSGAYTELALSTDSSGTSSIPNLNGKYSTTFDTNGSDYYEIRLVRTAASAATLYVANVVCGPGIQPQGAVVGEWVSYTPTFEGLGTVTNASARYRRVGDSMQVAFSVTSGTNTAVLATVSLPSGFTINSTSIPANSIVGDLSASATPFDSSLLYFSGASSKLYFTSGTANYTAGANGTTWANATGFGGNFFVPIAEWAGSGTVQLAQNDVEYAWNSDATTTASVTGSGFGYGPSGVTFTSSNWSLGTSYVRRVQFQTPIQAGDKVELEIDNNGTGTWESFHALYPRVVQGAVNYGATLYPVFGSTTQYDVAFYAGGLVANNTTYAQNGTLPWSGLGVSNTKWRVRKSSAGAAVGFGLYQPGVSAGLVSSSGLAGRADGNPIASGYVGENYSFQTGSGVAVTTAWNNVLTMSNLPAGVWLLTGMAELNNAGSVTGFNLAISAFAGTTTTDHVRGVNQLPCSVPANTGGSITIANWLVNISTPAPYYLKANSVGASSTLNCSLRAIRIA